MLIPKLWPEGRCHRVVNSLYIFVLKEFLSVTVKVMSSTCNELQEHLGLTMVVVT